MSHLDKIAIQRKYAEEREKRLRADGNDQYQRLEAASSELATDPYLPVEQRSPVTDDVTFAFVGAGFAGLVAGARLKEAGVESVRLIDKAGDVGGTWYWNRYPGAQCDTAAMIYLPLLEETGYRPTEKYVRGPEIFEHCQRIANHFDLYDQALFHTVIEDMVWQPEIARWLIKTNRGDAFTAKYVAMGTGPLHVAKLPRIQGMNQFQGITFHTSRWNYEYTGGDTAGAPMENLEDKRVAVIGTGATAVQCVPHLAQTAGSLYVFQRTPSSVDKRNNGPIDPEWFSSIAEPNWQQKWYDNFLDNMSMTIPADDFVNDGWTEISRRVREAVLSLPRDQINPQTIRQASEEADMEKMAEIRARVDAVVDSENTAEKLKAWYAQLCKRPCFHDEYLQAFNKPNTTLVDTNGSGVESITESAVVANGQEYEVDCIIYASGFEVGADFIGKAGFDLTGRDGKRLSEHWSNGMSTLHGIHMNGFPNAFMVQLNQAANFIPNAPHNLVDHAQTIAKVVAHAETVGALEVEPTEAAEKAWVELIAGQRGSMFGSNDCTPGYFNNEGQGWNEQFRRAQGHPGGAKAYFDYIKDWRESGEFEGLRFATASDQTNKKAQESAS